MSFWMYHSLTDSVFPVRAKTEEEVAKLAERLFHRIYFEAELTTAPVKIDDDNWWVKSYGNWTRFATRDAAVKYVADQISDGYSAQLYRRESRVAEVFMIEES